MPLSCAKKSGIMSGLPWKTMFVISLPSCAKYQLLAMSSVSVESSSAVIRIHWTKLKFLKWLQAKKHPQTRKRNQNIMQKSLSALLLSSSIMSWFKEDLNIPTWRMGLRESYFVFHSIIPACFTTTSVILTVNWAQKLTSYWGLLLQEHYVYAYWPSAHLLATRNDVNQHEKNF